MAVEHWDLVKGFKVGDRVQKVLPVRGGQLSPYYGKVTAVMPGIGFVDVQWPFGQERVSPEELLVVRMDMYAPPKLEAPEGGFDTTEQERKKKAAALWDTLSVPPTFYHSLAKLWHQGVGEVSAYDELWHRYASVCADRALKKETAKFYRVARKLGRLAAYWSAPGRQYRATQEEIAAGRPACPKCSVTMRKAIYKMEEGKRVHLFACPDCLKLIRITDLVDTGGNPVDWG